MKILYITTVGMTMDFFSRFVKKLIEDGHTVDIACGGVDSLSEYYKNGDFRVYPLTCSRFIADVGNIRAIRDIRCIVRKNHYDIVHCHTPIAAACTRLACRPLRKPTRRLSRGLSHYASRNHKKIYSPCVIYTAHGFHFFKGAPIKNWLIYYPVEKWLSRYTDVLITITKEDYRRANSRFYSRITTYIPGVGIDTASFRGSHQGKKIREEFLLTGDIQKPFVGKENLSNREPFTDKEIFMDEESLADHDDKILILSVGELNKNKNHEAVIRALPQLPKNIVYVIVGQGDYHDHLLDVAREVGVSDRVKLAGYRTDVVDFYEAADIYILPSLREGLNVSLMEAMAAGLPIGCGHIRGNIDLVDEAMGGYLFDPSDVGDIAKAIKKLINRLNTDEMGLYNKEKVKKFDYRVVEERLLTVYQERETTISSQRDLTE